MSTAPLLQLRNYLTRTSFLPGPVQSELWNRLNTSASTVPEGPALSHQVLESFWRMARTDMPSQLCPQWVQWEDALDGHGLGVILPGPKSHLLLLPENSDPPSIRLEPQPTIAQIQLIPSLSTLNQATGGFLYYFLCKDCRVRVRPPHDEEAYARFLLTEPYQSRLAPQGTARKHSAASPTLFLDEDGMGVYHALQALQEGMTHYLCAVMRGAPADGPELVSLDSIRGRYPTISRIRDHEKSSSLTIPPARLFGGAHPFHEQIQIRVSDSKPLFDRQGNIVGFSEIAAGGTSAHFAHSHIGGSTTVGSSTNQEDSLYLAEIQYPNMPPIRIFAVIDGLGGAVLGELASSAVAQGIDAAVTEAVHAGKIPFPHELAPAAAQALFRQLRFFRREVQSEVLEEMQNFPGRESDPFPDAVLSMAVVIGKKGFAATAGDALIALSRRSGDGSIEMIGFTDIDSSNDHMVHGTVRRQQWHYWTFEMPDDSCLIGATDGTFGSLLPHFKRRVSAYIRRETAYARPDQHMFYNLKEILVNTPAERLAEALVGVAGGSTIIPGLEGGGLIEAEYADLMLPPRELDNLTAAFIRRGRESWPEVALTVPDLYRPLEPVAPAKHYYFESPPREIGLPSLADELFLGSAPGPSGKLSMILPDKTLQAQHARIFRTKGPQGTRVLIEKLGWGGRIIIRRGEGSKTAESLILKGAKAEIHEDDRIELNAVTHFEFV